MLFQASEEKSEPTWATQNAMNKPNAPPAAVTVAMNGKFGLIGLTPRGVQKSVKLALMASAFLPKKSPIRIRAMSESVFVEVKIFWIHLPILRPRVLIHVSSTISSTATSCCVEKLTAYLDVRLIGGMIQAVGDMPGASTPR